VEGYIGGHACCCATATNPNSQATEVGVASATDGGVEDGTYDTARPTRDTASTRSFPVVASNACTNTEGAGTVIATTAYPNQKDAHVAAHANFVQYPDLPPYPTTEPFTLDVFPTQTAEHKQHPTKSCTTDTPSTPRRGYRQNTRNSRTTR
jgi:hypothetical protein